MTIKHSSPSPGGQTETGPQAPRSPRTKDSGKPLHIKPRL
uniref:Zc3h3 protein n=1 Tax=Mus musculus TaxID=10090 RepID=Q14DV8_MOUSE|nr:Zc3h3 protein [Mus musculus]